MKAAVTTKAGNPEVIQLQVVPKPKVKGSTPFLATKRSGGFISAGWRTRVQLPPKVGQAPFSLQKGVADKGSTSAESRTGSFLDTKSTLAVLFSFKGMKEFAVLVLRSDAIDKI